MKIRSVGAELIHSDEQMYRESGGHDETNSPFSPLYECA